MQLAEDGRERHLEYLVADAEDPLPPVFPAGLGDERANADAATNTLRPAQFVHWARMTTGMTINFPNTRMRRRSGHQS